MANAIVSEPIDLSASNGYAVQAAWTGVTGSGTLYLQATCFPQEQGIWTQIASSSMTVSGASGNDMWNVTVANYKWAQLIWAPSGSVSGTLTAYASVK